MMLFIDANIYLDFYRMRKVKPLLKPLIDIKDYVFVTKQVVDEVYRNKADIAVQMLKEDAKRLGFTMSLPDSLIQQAVLEIDPGIIRKLEKLNENFKEFKKIIEDIYDRTILQVSESTDEISQALDNIFTHAASPTDQQIDFARKRKELGNSPGKKGDPIGDQLSWEQLISYSLEYNYPVWIVSNDGDFSTKTTNGGVVGNPMLLREIKEKNLPAFIFFDNLATALKQFKTEVRQNLSMPTEQVLEEAALAQRIKDVGSISDKCRHLSTTIIEEGLYDYYVCNACNSKVARLCGECD